MASTTQPTVLRYDSISAGLHWLTAALIITAIIVVLWAEEAGKDLGLQLIFLHKSLGITVFGVILLRVVWRFLHRAPPLPSAIPGWQKSAAKAVHFALYTLMLALPVSGYLLSTKSSFPLEWFGNELPKAPVSEGTAELASEVHVVLAWVLVAMVALHIAAALWHRIAMRDRLMARMALFSRQN